MNGFSKKVGHYILYSLLWALGTVLAAVGLLLIAAARSGRAPFSASNIKEVEPFVFSSCVAAGFVGLFKWYYERIEKRRKGNKRADSDKRQTVPREVRDRES